MAVAVYHGKGADDKIEYVMSAMTEGRFRHLPVLAGSELVGLVSIGDVVKAELQRVQTQVSELIDYVAAPKPE